MSIQKFSSEDEKHCLKDTARHQFISEISRTTSLERQKWLANDNILRKRVILHKIQRFNPDDNLYSGGFGKTEIKDNSLQAVKHEEMSRVIFREALLQRCASKCPFVLTCNGLAVDKLQNIYLSTDYFEGRTLKECATRVFDLSLNDIKKISFQLLKALNFIHSIRIAHNDVTMENVLLCHNDVSGKRDDENMQIKLCNFSKARDFGIRTERCDSYLCGQCETSPYTSDPSYDMLCFGYLLFEILQGSRPWKTSCFCDEKYKKYYKKLQKYKKIDDTQLNRVRPESAEFRRNNLSHDKKGETSYSNRKMHRIIDGLKGNADFPSTSQLSGQPWNEFSPKFSKCISLLLSPFPTLRPTSGELLGSYSYFVLFDTSRAGDTWKKERIIKRLATVLCMFF